MTLTNASASPSIRSPRQTRVRVRTPFAALGATLFLLVPWLGCGGSRTECRAEQWSGTCELLSVTKVRESELPLPSVVLETIYRPKSDPAGKPVALPDVRREFTALSKHESALEQHLKNQALVRCYVTPASPGTCTPGQMVVDVPEFDAATATVNAPDTGPKGCAQIEAASSQDRVMQNQKDAVVIPERILFGEGSAELPSDAAALIEAVATRMKSSPELECVGIVGQWVRGESMEVAFARARAVRELLLARGVEPERLVALTVSGQLVATTANPDAPDPADRKVAFSVLLEVKPKP